MIIRRKHTGNFAVIPNGTANDEKLKADTLGALVYLLAKPEDWKVSIADLRKRFGVGRDRVYAMLLELETAGYVKREQGRSGERSMFTSVEYVVYDCPQSEAVPETCSEDNEPLPASPYPDNQEAVKSQQITASGFTVSGATVSGKSGHILKTDLTKPSSKEDSASEKAGAEAPSVSAKIWKEGRELLQNSPSKPNSSIIGKWLKRAVTPEAKVKLLAMIAAARNAGTDDPVGYVTAALNRECPAPADPKTLDLTTWQRNVMAALKTKAWSPAWGPAPGLKGCLMPSSLVTPELLRALSERRIAA